MSHHAVVPSVTEKGVAELLQNNSLDGTPVVLPYRDFGYESGQCHISAKHHVIVHGGKRVHGWALWRYDHPDAESMYVAEHHSIWEDASGQLVDVTPPRDGAAAILFLRDDTATINSEGGNYLIRTDLTNWPEVPRLFVGERIFYEFVPFDPAAPPAAIADYAASLNFDMAHYLTEPGIG